MRFQQPVERYGGPIGECQTRAFDAADASYQTEIKATVPEDLQKAGGNLTAARMIAFERLCASGVSSAEAMKQVLAGSTTRKTLLSENATKGTVVARPDPNAPLIPA